MPKGVYQRVPVEVYKRLGELERLRDADERRISALERRIRQMNESFERGYLPPNVQTDH